MNLAVVHSRGSDGIDAPPVRVEVQLGPGLPALLVVGASTTVGVQARERVRAALNSSGWQIPSRKITVSLTPAEQPKDGGRFDLPIAVGILAANSDLPLPSLREMSLFGELALTGGLHPTRGILPAVIAALAAGHACIVPAADAPVLAGVQGPIHCARTLTEAADFLRGRRTLPCPADLAVAQETEHSAADLRDIAAQDDAKRALQIAAAGGHHLLMLGPPGCGKTMLAERLAGILPPLDQAASMQAQVIASVAGTRLADTTRAPFRSLHHSTSATALLGGGNTVYPGEVTLAHQGVLFMDEFAEWPRDVLNLMRQPLQDRNITIKRGKRSVTYPAAFQLIAASNLCPCGRKGTLKEKCKCRADEVERYMRRMSGPLLDRMDLQVTLKHLKAEEMHMRKDLYGESTAAVQKKVLQARQRQLQRNGCINALLDLPQMQDHCKLDYALQMRFNRLCDERGLSVRGMHRTLRVARTIADLDGSENIRSDHVVEALYFSPGTTEPDQMS